MTTKIKYVICRNCSWVAAEVSLDYAITETHQFNQYYLTLSPQQREDNYRSSPSSISQYMECQCCGKSYKQFRKALKRELPNGSTLSPIVGKDE